MPSKKLQLQSINKKTSLSKSDIKKVCDILRRDDGVGAKNYVEQLSWLLFLKVFENVEEELKELAEAEGKKYQNIIDPEYQWSTWAKKDWKDKDELVHFVNQKLFPYLKTLKGSKEKDKIGEVFRELSGNLIRSAHNLLDIIDILDQIEMKHFQDTHLLSQVYEEILQEMGSEGGWAGEFYTPRPIIRLIVKIVNPKIGETIFDPFVGSGGFLIESFDYLQKQTKNIGVKEWNTLQNKTFFGQEKTPLPYLIGTMNMMLHRILVPNLTRTNTFMEDIHNVPESFKKNIVMTNPPFGGKEHLSVQNNFPIPVSATEGLALQYVMKALKNGGRCGIILPESDVIFAKGKYKEIREKLLTSNNVFAIISLPKGVFKQVGADVKTYLIFFDKSHSTKSIWYYELEGNFTRTKMVSDKDLEDAYNSFISKKIGKNSWLVSYEELEKNDFNLRAINKNKITNRNYNPVSLAQSISEKISILSDYSKKIDEEVKSKINHEEFIDYNLSDLITRSKLTIDIKNSEKYKRITIQMHAKGIKIRDEIDGIKIGTKKQFLVKDGQLLISKIDARNGAYGIIPPECDGAIITGNFWAYDIDTKKILPDFFSYILQTDKFLDFFEKSSQGSTNRRYLQEQLFLGEEVRIPKMESQKELLKIFELSSKVKNEIGELNTLASDLIISLLNNLFKK